MSYTARNYRETASAVRSQVAQILASENLTDGERLVAIEALNNVAGPLADIFEKDNRRSFDRERFLTDAGLGPRDWKNLVCRETTH